MLYLGIIDYSATGEGNTVIIACSDFDSEDKFKNWMHSRYEGDNDAWDYFSKGLEIITQEHTDFLEKAKQYDPLLFKFISKYNYFGGYLNFYKSYYINFT